MADTQPGDLHALSVKLGVSAAALMDYRWSWAAEWRSWATPMVDGEGEMVGFRLRREDGTKFSVRGGHEGIFVPWVKPQRQAVLVEGPSDAAAAATLGFYAIGRPSCSGGLTAIIRTIRRLGIERVVVIPDDDSASESERGRNPGLAGGALLSKHLPVPHCTLILPAKDLRSCLAAGLDATTLDSMIKQLIWVNPERTK